MRAPFRVIVPLAVTAFAVLWVVWWLGQSGALPKFGDRYTVQAEVPSSEALTPGSHVRIAGLEAGRVTSVDRVGRAGLLELELDSEHEPIPADSRVAIRLRTLVGENYVEVYPGDSSEDLPDGGLLPMDQADEFVALDQIFSQLRGRTRDRARRFVQSLGGAVRDRGAELNSLVYGTAGTLRAGSTLTGILARDRGRVARLVDNLGGVAAAIGERGASVRQLGRGLRQTFEAIASRDRALRGTLDELPPALRQVRDTSGVIETVTAGSEPVIWDLAAAVRELNPAVESLRPAAREGRAVARELGAAAPRVRTTVRRLRELSGPAASALPKVGDTLCQLNPALDFLAPYANDIPRPLQLLASWSNYSDATGHSARVMAVPGEGSHVMYDEPTRDAVSTLVDFGFLGEFHYRGYNPLPAPGQAGGVNVGVGWSGPSDVQIDYPRVEAEC